MARASDAELSMSPPTAARSKSATPRWSEPLSNLCSRGIGPSGIVDLSGYLGTAWAWSSLMNNLNRQATYSQWATEDRQLPRDALRRTHRAAVSSGWTTNSPHL